MVPDPEGKAQPTYRSYLLRLWRANNAGQPVCRTSLEEPGGHPLLHFESLAAMCAYLAAQMGATKGEETPGAADQEGE